MLESLACEQGSASLSEAVRVDKPVVPALSDARVVAELRAAAGTNRVNLRSIRRGAATLLAASGVSHRQLMLYGFWRSESSPTTYVRWGYHTTEPITAFLIGAKSPAFVPSAPSNPPAQWVKAVWDKDEGWLRGPARWAGVMIALEYYASRGYADVNPAGGRVWWFDNLSGAVHGTFDDVDSFAETPSAHADEVHPTVKRCLEFATEVYIPQHRENDVFDDFVRLAAASGGS